MKFYNLTLVGMIPVLASSAFARPGAKVADDAGPLPERSRVTAFVNTDEGLRVECWEIGGLLPESVPSTPRHCDSKGTPHRTQMGVGAELLFGIEVVTWPPSDTPIFPPPSGYASTAVDFRAKPNLFTVKDGLIFIEALAVSPDSIRDDEEEYYVFADVNGDDWFYFEDTTSSSERAKRTSEPFIMRTVSGSDTTLINFRYKSTPQHTVLHGGRCNFAGLKPVGENTVDKDLEQARMTVQEL